MSKQMEQVRDLIDRLARPMSRAEYRKFLDEIGSEVEIREMAVSEEEDNEEE